MASQELRTHCHKGHPYSGNNVRIRRAGKGKFKRACLTCERNQPPKIRRKLQAAARSGGEVKIMVEEVEERRVIDITHRLAEKKTAIIDSKPHSKRADHVAVLKSTPPRTREELEQLVNPSPSELSRRDRDLVRQTDWGLLGRYYPIHRTAFVSIKGSRQASRNPLPTAFEHSAEGFIQFILEVGLPEKDFTSPSIQLIEREKGYVPGNFRWIERGIKTSQSMVPAKEIPYIVFNGRKFYETFYQGEKEHIWNYSVEDLPEVKREGGPRRRFLRTEVWSYYHGGIVSNRSAVYIDPEGDLTDPFNLRLTLGSRGHNGKLAGINSYGSEQTARERKAALRQALADIACGCIKTCLGCCAEWRIMGDKVLVLREGTPGQLGPCEEKHNRAKEIEQWKSATEAYRAGERFRHVPLAKGESDEEDEESVSSSSYVPLL